MEIIILAVSGDQGSFSEEAARAYAAREGFVPTIVYAIDMEGVLQILDRGEAELGIFPVVNSLGGLVQPAFEAMGKHNFQLVGQLALEVNQCLLVFPGMLKSQITAVATHPQALAQCTQYLKREFPSAHFMEWEDTAKAARDLKDGKLSPNTATIAPLRAAEVYGLEVLEKRIQDSNPNITTFIVVKSILTEFRNTNVEGASLSTTDVLFAAKKVPSGGFRNSAYFIESLQDFRSRIDRIDAGIIQFLAERFEVAKKIGAVKKSEGIPVSDPLREKEIKKARKQLAVKYKIDLAVVEKLFETIITESKKMQ